MIITILMAKNVYEQDDHYQGVAKKVVRFWPDQPERFRRPCINQAEC